MKRIPDRRLKEKKPKEKKPGRTPIAKKIFLIGLFLIAQVIFLNSDFFRLHTVEISGCERIPNEDIVEAAKFPWGTNIVFLDLLPYKDLIEKLLWIKSVSLAKIYPGGVYIEVKERTPAISVRSKDNNKWFEMDEEGVVLAEQKKGILSDLPHLIVSDKLKVGQRLDSFDIDTIIKFYTWLSPEMSKNIKDFKVEGNSLLSFRYNAGTRIIDVKLGKLENVEQKIDVFNKILRELVGKIGVIEYIDLRYREPVVKINDGQTSIKSESSKSDETVSSDDAKKPVSDDKPVNTDQTNQADSQVQQGQAVNPVIQDNSSPSVSPDSVSQPGDTR